MRDGWRTWWAGLLTVVSTVLSVALSGCTITTGGTSTPTPSADGASPTSGSGAGYRFLRTRQGGAPIRWSTCEPIRWVVRPDGEPDGARALLRDSVRRISEATGLELTFAGTTEESPRRQRPPYQPDRYGDRWAPVLVTYATPQQDSRLEGRAAGYGGPTSVRTGNRAPRYVSGQVVLDTEQMTSMGGEDARRAVMLHELAHVMGLAHVDDRGQLMNPVLYGREVTELQPGDLAGLEALGNGRCYEPIEPRRIRTGGASGSG
jgi:hypothetical protein